MNFTQHIVERLLVLEARQSETTSLLQEVLSGLMTVLGKFEEERLARAILKDLNDLEQSQKQRGGGFDVN